MRLRRLSVAKYRGIESLEWAVNRDVVALIGPGDSRKSTVLDAIELALSPRWNVATSDNDFWQADTSEPFRIDATVGDLPPSLVADNKFGLHLRGITDAGELRDEPEDTDDLVLTIRVEVDSGLEPSWTVVNDRLPEGRTISGQDRGLLGVTRLGSTPDRHLTWARGSALTGLTEGGASAAVSAVIADAYRATRNALGASSLASLDAVLGEANKQAARLGVGAATDDLRAGLSADAVSARAAALVLHSGKIPLERAGLGTRRLVALAVQLLSAPAGAIVLIDEIEAGLEPFRLRHLLRVLQQLAADGQQGAALPQVILTTHSPACIEELDATSLHVVRSESGVVAVKEASESLQPVARSNPEAFLGRRIVVCEGPTEVGLCLGLEPWWSSAHGGRPTAHVGVVPVNGGGRSDAPRRALALTRMGYPSVLLADSDEPIDPDRATLEAEGVVVIQWLGKMATEDRVAADLPWANLVEMLDLVAKRTSKESVADAVLSRLNRLRGDAGDGPSAWLDAGIEEGEIRVAVGLTAKAKRWFKRTDHGEELGGVLARCLTAIPDSDLHEKLGVLSGWIYGDDGSG